MRKKTIVGAVLVAGVSMLERSVGAGADGASGFGRWRVGGIGDGGWEVGGKGPPWRMSVGSWVSTPSSAPAFARSSAHRGQAPNLSRAT